MGNPCMNNYAAGDGRRVLDRWSAGRSPLAAAVPRRRAPGLVDGPTFRHGARPRRERCRSSSVSSTRSLRPSRWTNGRKALRANRISSGRRSIRSRTSSPTISSTPPAGSSTCRMAMRVRRWWTTPADFHGTPWEPVRGRRPKPSASTPTRISRPKSEDQPRRI